VELHAAYTERILLALARPRAETIDGHAERRNPDFHIFRPFLGCRRRMPPSR
jgi:hypothetical protein